MAQRRGSDYNDDAAKDDGFEDELDQYQDTKQNIYSKLMHHQLQMVDYS